MEERRIPVRSRGPGLRRHRRSAMMGLCDLTPTTSRCCPSTARKKQASAGGRRLNRTTTSGCAGTCRRTGTSEPGLPLTRSLRALLLFVCVLVLVDTIFFTALTPLLPHYTHVAH